MRAASSVVAEQPERVGQADQAGELGILPVAEQVHGAVLGPPARERALEVRPRRLEPALPERGDGEHPGALDPEDVVAGALGAGAQLLAEGRRGVEVAVRERRERQRAHQRRLRRRPDAARQAEGAVVHLDEPLRAVAVEGDQRRGQRGEDRELARLALAGGRELAAERQRTLERPGGARGVVPALRGLGRADMPADRLVGGARGLVVRGERRAGGIDVGAVRPLERARHAEMEVPPLRGTQRLVRGLADAAVTEVVGVEPVGAHDPAPPQLVEPADERLLVETAGVGQDRAGELAADRRGDARQLVRRPGEPRQPRGDHRLDPVAVAAFRAGLDGLDEEQRVALGLGEQALGLGLAEPLPSIRSASRSDSPRLSRSSPISVQRPSACSPAVSSATGCRASISSRRAVAATSSGAVGSVRSR